MEDNSLYNLIASVVLIVRIRDGNQKESVIRLFNIAKTLLFKNPSLYSNVMVSL